MFGEAIKPEGEDWNALTQSVYSNAADQLFPTITEDYERVFEYFVNASLALLATEVKTFKIFQQNLHSADQKVRSVAELQVEAYISKWKHRFNILPDDSWIQNSFLSVLSLVLSPNQLNDEFEVLLSSCYFRKKY